MITFKEWNLFEAVYSGMVGIMELIKFEAVATPAEKKMFQALLAAKKNKEALQFLEAKLKIKFQ
jgi:hypothetical protein